MAFNTQLLWGIMGGFCAVFYDYSDFNFSEHLWVQPECVIGLRLFVLHGCNSTRTETQSRCQHWAVRKSLDCLWITYACDWRSKHVTWHAKQLHVCTCVLKYFESLKLSVCVVLLLKPQSGPRNFIYQEMDRAPRRALFRNTHTYYK